MPQMGYVVSQLSACPMLRDVGLGGCPNHLTKFNDAVRRSLRGLLVLEKNSLCLANESGPYCGVLPKASINQNASLGRCGIALRSRLGCNAEALQHGLLRYFGEK